MRCYFLRRNDVQGVTFLKAAPDRELIRQAKSLFLARAETEHFDGFEVWEGNRLVHREPVTGERPAPSGSGADQGLDR